MGILMTITMIAPGAVSFAETIPDAESNSADTVINENKSAEETKATGNLESQAVEASATSNSDAAKGDENKDGSVTVNLTDKGNGSFNAKLKNAADETTKEVYAGKTATLKATVGDEIELSTYALDGNKTNINAKDAEVTQQIAYGDNCKLVYIKITGANPSVDISFTGGESLGSSTQVQARMMRGVSLFRATASSMSAYVKLDKYQYGYNSSGRRYYPNKYGLFTSGTSGVYGGAIYCAEHDRTPTTGSMTGYTVSDSTLRKILYYGYKGPAQWSGFSSPSYNSQYKVWGSNTNRTEIAGTVITSQALSNRFNALGGRGTATNPAGLNAFMSYVNSQPDPSAYTVYKATASGQDMMWGVYNPKGKLQLVKEVKNNKTLTEQCKNMYSLALFS